MNFLQFNDQAFIAESFNMDEDFTFQSARLAYFKINSYRMAQVNAGFSTAREELRNSIENSLLNYVDTDLVLITTGYFDQETEN